MVNNECHNSPSETVTHPKLYGVGSSIVLKFVLNYETWIIWLYFGIIINNFSFANFFKN